VAADPTRRALLAATATLPLLVAGCRGTQALGTPPRPAPDVGVLRAATIAEQDMVARYQAALRRLRDGAGTGTAAVPTVTAVLAGLLAQHEDHLRQLRARHVAGSPLAAGSAPLPRPSAAALPARPRRALAALARAEQAASDNLLAQLGAASPALAQLLASIAASEATHVPALHAIGRP
jgi:hypothetical protein